jgi:cardiolipin synthase (CMP-forming)
MASVPRTGEDRILTVPNALTLARLVAVPVFLWLALRPHRRDLYPAAFLLAGLGATDWLDGSIARHFHQVSTLGKVLDPMADRILLGAAAAAAIATGSLPLVIAIPALVREVVVSTGFLAVAAAGGRRIDVQWAGKAGTFLLMFALPLFLAGHAPDGWATTAHTLGWVCAVPGLVLGWYAAVTYVPKARSALAEGRTSRDDEEALT